MSAPPRVIVTTHAIDRFLRRSGLGLPRFTVVRVLQHAVVTGEWTPLPESRKSSVRLVAEGRELHAVVAEDGGSIFIVTVLTPGQLAGYLVDPSRRERAAAR